MTIVDWIGSRCGDPSAGGAFGHALTAGMVLPGMLGIKAAEEFHESHSSHHSPVRPDRRSRMPAQIRPVGLLSRSGLAEPDTLSNCMKESV